MEIAQEARPARSRWKITLVTALLGVFLFSLATALPEYIRRSKPDSGAFFVGPRRADSLPPLLQKKASLPPEMETLSDAQKETRALQEIDKGNSEIALALLQTLAIGAQDKGLRARGILYLAETLLRQEGKRKDVEELYQYFLAAYPQDPRRDKALYQLGLVAFEAGRFGLSAYYFTTLLNDLPQSSFAPSAAFLAKRSAQALGQEELSAKGRVTSFIENIMPKDLLSLFTFLSYLLTLLISLIIGRIKKEPVVWFLMILFLVLSSVNYAMNRIEQKRYIAESVSAGELRQ